jgi:hypothetical protein
LSSVNSSGWRTNVLAVASNDQNRAPLIAIK